MIEIRKFNDHGIDRFYDFIENTRIAEKAKAPALAFPDLHNENDLTSKITSINCQIDETKQFSNRFEMAKYLNQICPELKNEYHAFGAWAWLASVYFSQLRQRGKEKTQRAEHFIPDECRKQTNKGSLAYRHSVRMAYFLYKDYTSEFAKFILTGRPAHAMGDPWDQCCSRKKVLSSPAIQNLILKLYQDPSTLSVKKGAYSDVNKKSRKSIAGKGGCRRLVTVLVPRLKKSFDVEEMSPEDLIKRAGRELISSQWVKTNK